MPFEQTMPRPFTRIGIEQHAPAESGVYGISNASEWIYIGEADDIRSRLLEHLSEPSPFLMQRRPTGFVFEVCPPERRRARQDRLVIEYEPHCNRHPYEPPPSPEIRNPFRDGRRRA